MSKLVVDSSVAIKWFVAEVDDQKAKAILTAQRNNTISLFAPALLYTEVGNILWKKHRQGILTINKAQQTLAELRTIPLTIVPDSEPLDEALRLAIQHNRSVYDSLYLALSLREDCPFVTADERFVNAIGNAFPNALLLARYS